MTLENTPFLRAVSRFRLSRIWILCDENGSIGDTPFRSQVHPFSRMRIKRRWSCQLSNGFLEIRIPINFQIDQDQIQPRLSPIVDYAAAALYSTEWFYGPAPHQSLNHCTYSSTIVKTLWDIGKAILTSIPSCPGYSLMSSISLRASAQQTQTPGSFVRS